VKYLINYNSLSCSTVKPINNPEFFISMVWVVVQLSILGSARQAIYRFQESRGGTIWFATLDGMKLLRTYQDTTVFNNFIPHLSTTRPDIPGRRYRPYERGRTKQDHGLLLDCLIVVNVTSPYVIYSWYISITSVLFMCRFPWMAHVSFVYVLKLELG